MSYKINLQPCRTHRARASVAVNQVQKNEVELVSLFLLFTNRTEDGEEINVRTIASKTFRLAG